MKKVLNIFVFCAFIMALTGTYVFAAPMSAVSVENVTESTVDYEAYMMAEVMAEYVSRDGISFSVSKDKTLTVSGNGMIKNVPSELRNEKIVYLVIENGINAIGENAFLGFEELKYISVPASLKYIGKGAFDGTEYVSNKPGKAVYIGKILYKYNGEFDGQLQLDILSDTVGIAENAFYGRTEIEKVDFPDTLEVIGENAFNGCTFLSEITFGSNVKYVGQDAFCDTAWEKSQTETIVIGKTLYKHIGNEETYEIQKGVEYISGRAFSDSAALKEIVLGKNVKYICENAFHGCENLENIAFSESVQRIGENAFYGTKWLSSQQDGMVYINDIAVLYKGEMEKYARVEIKEGTRVLENSLFRDMKNLYSLFVPESVEVIGDDALSGCFNVTVYAKKGSFAEKYALENSIPVREEENVDEVVSTGKDGNISWTLYESGKLVLSGEGVVGFPSEVDRNTVTKVEIGDGITGIAEEAFSGCWSLSEIAFSESLEYVGANAFYGTEWLDEKQGAVYTGNILYAYIGEIPDGVLEVREGTTHISAAALSDNTSLVSLVLPESLVYVGTETFFGCENLVSISGGNNIAYIGTDAFENTEFLDEKTGTVYIGKTLYSYNGDAPSGTVLEINDGTVSVSAFACFGLGGISDIVFPETLVEIGEGAFSYCDGLGRLSIPETVEKIGENAFDGCDNIVLAVTRPSRAHEYAKQNRIPFEADGTASFGDVDGDGSITIKDAILLSQYVSGNAEPDSVPINAADVYTDNGEAGIVNQNDIIHLCKYLAGNDVVLG